MRGIEKKRKETLQERFYPKHQSRERGQKKSRILEPWTAIWACSHLAAALCYWRCPSKRKSMIWLG